MELEHIALGSLVLHERSIKKLSQIRFGAICGLTQSKVSKIETGDYVPDFLEMNLISDVLGIPVETIHMRIELIVTRAQEIVDETGTQIELESMNRNAVIGLMTFVTYIIKW